jgi:predicted acylesterase/phospholipase RssA
MTVNLWNRGSQSKFDRMPIHLDSRPIPRTNPRIGLALSGGGAKSAAHIGVIQALLQTGVLIDLVAGTSGGALAGLFLCDGHSPASMSRILKDELVIGRFWRMLPWGKYWQLSRLFRRGNLTQMLSRHIRARKFSELRIPFFATATDLLSGERVVLQDGDVVRAVMASMSLPGLTPPVEHEGRRLVDGGVLHYIPADVLRENGADIVIGVDLGGCNAPSDEWKNWNEGDGSLQVLRRAWAIQNRELARRQLEEVDVVIRPEVNGFGIADLLKMERLIDRGVEAGARAASEIDHVISKWEARQRRKHVSAVQGRFEEAS